MDSGRVGALLLVFIASTPLLVQGATQDDVPINPLNREGDVPSDGYPPGIQDKMPDISDEPVSDLAGAVGYHQPLFADRIQDAHPGRTRLVVTHNSLEVGGADFVLNTNQSTDLTTATTQDTVELDTGRVGAGSFLLDGEKLQSAGDGVTLAGGTGTLGLHVKHDGRIGIGTYNPQSGYILDVQGDTNIGGDLFIRGDLLGKDVVDTPNLVEDSVGNYEVDNSQAFDMNALTINDNSVLKSNGQVGVNTTSPESGAALDVEGNIVGEGASIGANSYGNSLAVGNNALADCGDCIALGSNAKATAPVFNAIALGNADATANGAMALGEDSKASGIVSAAIAGGKASALDATGIAYGEASGQLSVAMGFNSYAQGGSSLALGANPRLDASSTTASAPGSVAIGSGVSVSKRESLVAGFNGKEMLFVDDSSVGVNTTSPEDGAALDVSGALVSGSSSLGSNADSDSVALGKQALANGPGAVAIGDEAHSEGTQSVAIGVNGNASGQWATALGTAAEATNTNSVALGHFAQATGWQSNALGPQTHAWGESSTALGYGAKATGNGAVALTGDAAGNFSISVAGGFATSSATGSHAYSDARVSGSNVVGIGDMEVFRDDRIVLGMSESRQIVLADGNVGIEADSPDETLHVNGNTLIEQNATINYNTVLQSNGQVGVNTTSPESGASLDVEGKTVTKSLKIPSDGTNPAITLVNDGGSEVTINDGISGELKIESDNALFGSNECNYNNGYWGCSGQIYAQKDVRADASVIAQAPDTISRGEALQSYGDAYVDGDVKLTGELQAVSGSDLAEWMPAEPGVEQGDVVVVNKAGRLQRTASRGDKTVVGIVTTDPGLVLGNESEDKAEEARIALSGTVPVKATSSVTPGDRLQTSSKPGLVTKCTQSCTGKMVGKALERVNETHVRSIVTLG